MALDFYSTLDQLLTPTVDMGGAPRPDDAKALAQLIMGGGRASLEGQPILGSTGMPLETGAQQAANAAAMGGFGRTPDGSAAPGAKPMRSSLKEVLDTADQIAGSMGSPNANTRAEAISRTLLPNPYGPGSYDPRDAAAVKQIQEQGAKAQQVSQVQELIKQITGNQPSMNITSYQPSDRPAAMAQYAQDVELAKSRNVAASPIVRTLLEGLGLGENDYQKEYQKALGKAQGEKAGGKGNTVANDLVRSAGTEKFGEQMAKAIADGSIDARQQDTLEKLHTQRWNSSALADQDTRTLANLRTSTESLRRVEEAYKGTEAYKTGKASDALKQALALTSKGASAIELAGVMNKLTPEERRYVSEYNVFQLNLRGVSQDSRFSNFDSQRVIDAIGNPMVGKDLYTEQMRTAVNELENRNDNLLDSLEANNKRVAGQKRFKQKQAAAAPAGKILVVRPDGQEGYIREEQWSEAEKAGYKRK